MIKTYKEQLTELRAREAAGTLAPFAEQLAAAEALRESEGRLYAERDRKYVIYFTDKEMEDVVKRADEEAAKPVPPSSAMQLVQQIAADPEALAALKNALR